MSLQTASPKMKVPMRLGMSVKGMQQTASIRSLSARESRKELVTVRRRRFRSSTATTRAFPQTLSTKISVYSRTRTVRSRSAGGRVTGCHAYTLVAPQQGRAAWPRCAPPGSLQASWHRRAAWPSTVQAPGLHLRPCPAGSVGSWELGTRVPSMWM